MGSVEVILRNQRRRRWSLAGKAALVRRTYEPGRACRKPWSAPRKTRVDCALVLEMHHDRQFEVLAMHPS
ncbi:hypothetical protein XthCFBP4691_19035 [Xanthomonas theicola]|uniref:Uncharacterized protein n=1 Tax=Xanthomonas theicola TaxID=56464 RepID=A0A2S6ZAG9_9XANT|nr:hypothetical protein XthCFBP4691_19035 [Xanthomonas theicola]